MSQQSWQQIRAAEDAACYAEGHACLCAAARRLMPAMSEERATACRVAMLANDSRGLRELIQQHRQEVA